jgi:hypothetical protein
MTSTTSEAHAAGNGVPYSSGAVFVRDPGRQRRTCSAQPHVGHGLAWLGGSAIALHAQLTQTACMLTREVARGRRDPDTILAFSKDAVNNVVEAYCPIVRKHMNDPFTPEEKQWQQVWACLHRRLVMREAAVIRHTGALEPRMASDPVC